jgi:Zn-dependent protease with chaperone function
MSGGGIEAGDTGVVQGIDSPSLVGRALASGLLLLGFFVLVFATAAALFVVPIEFARDAGWRNFRIVIACFVVCWIPAALLVGSVRRLRRPRFTPPGEPLREAEAPELFGMIRELSGAVGLPAPSRVYLVDEVTLAVTEDASERVLIIGAPLLAQASVDELRAGLAHEMGHFAFGDTRLTGVISAAHESFRAVLESTRRRQDDHGGHHFVVAIGFGLAQALGDAIVTFYAKLYFRVTRPASRRAELAADQVAARLAGRESMVALLEKIAVARWLFERYLAKEVDGAIAAGALPTDLLPGFEAFCGRVEARGEVGPVRLEFASRETSEFDTHPSTADRIAALRNAPAATRAPDRRSALALIRFDLDTWFGRQFEAALRAGGITNLRRVPWTEVPRMRGELLLRRARNHASALRMQFPSATTLPATLSGVLQRYREGNTTAIALTIAPALADVAPHQRDQHVRAIAIQALGGLLCGALLEGGAALDAALGEEEPGVTLEGQTVYPFALAARAFSEQSAADEVQRWASTLGGARVEAVTA